MYVGSILGIITSPVAEYCKFLVSKKNNRSFRRQTDDRTKKQIKLKKNTTLFVYLVSDSTKQFSTVYFDGIVKTFVEF